MWKSHNSPVHLSPLWVYPGGHPHLYDPWVLMQSWEHTCWPVWHSSTSRQVVPSGFRTYPGLQEHVYDPSVLVQENWQGFGICSHSFTSTKWEEIIILFCVQITESIVNVLFLPLHRVPDLSGWYPLSQRHLYDPIEFMQRPFLHKSCMVKHSSISESNHHESADDK